MEIAARLDVAAPRRTDLDLMVEFMGLLVDAVYDLDGSIWLASLSELKARGLVRQTRSGRALPTEKGQALWNNARLSRARNMLKERPTAGRPFFVVFSADGSGMVYSDWDAACGRARSVVAADPASFAGLGSPEDAVEVWTRIQLGPAIATAVERDGSAVMEDEE